MPNSIDPVACDVRDVARLLCCSPRHVWSLAATGKMPPALRLGRLARWSVEEIEAWIRAGAPDAATWKAAKEGAAT